MDNSIKHFIGSIIFYNQYKYHKGEAQIYNRRPVLGDSHWIDNEPFYGREYREPIIIKFPFYE